MNDELLVDRLTMPVPGPVWRVGELTAHVRDTLEAETAFADLWVQGEIASSNTSGAGHTFFTLQDGSSRLSCVLFRRRSIFVGIPEQGSTCLVRGRLTVYEAGGQYQIVVSDHRPAGIGDLFTQFQRVKSRLQTEGLFDAERKRPLPQWPSRIGVVTSARGAALQDLCKVLERRYPMVELVVAPSLVQGTDAPAALLLGLNSLNSLPDLDLIIVTRGGGSAEDLWAFNDEQLARAVAASPLPVVSAVGHEVDFTIIDAVADVRAPTPSAAGEMAVPDSGALLLQLVDLSKRLQRASRKRTKEAEAQTGALLDRLRRSMTLRLESSKARLLGLQGRLVALNPRAVLGRGYALVRDPSTGRLRPRTAGLRVGDTVNIEMFDGTIVANVTDVLEDGDRAKAVNPEREVR